MEEVKCHWMENSRRKNEENFLMQRKQMVDISGGREGGGGEVDLKGCN